MKIYIFLLPISALFSYPSGPTVVAGDVRIDDQRPSLEITSGDRSIIEWKNFSVHYGEKAHFILPGPKSAVLNRVTGSTSSIIKGSLESNGAVYLINPNGILFGEHVILNVGSLIASTLDVCNDNFMHHPEELVFIAANRNAITNAGELTAQEGDIFLISYEIEQRGALIAQKGTVGLGAGTRVILRETGQERIFVEKTISESPKNPRTPPIDQTGVIRAVQAELKADGSLYAMAMNHSGSVDAKGIEERDGRIFLQCSEGSVYVTGSCAAANENGTGGEIRILGKEVGIEGAARIETANERSGGTILIGGSYQGKDPAIENSEVSFVGQDVVLKADALANGDGGEIIVWSDGNSHYYGMADVRGGPGGGDGGLIEVSGKEFLEFQGKTSRNSPMGKPGELLLDPNDFRVVSGMGLSAGVTFGGACGLRTYCVTGAGMSPATIGDATLITELDTGGPVTITTSGSVFDKGETGIFSVDPSADVIWTSGNSLTVNAVDIDIQGTITVDGLGNMFFNASRDMIVGGSQTASLQVGSLDNNVVTVIVGGNLTVASTAVGGVRLNGQHGLYVEVGGTLTLARVVNFAGISAIGIDGPASPLTVIAGDVSVSGGAEFQNSGLFTLTTAGDVSLTTFGSANVGQLDATIGGDLLMDAGTLAPSTIAGPHVLRITGNLDMQNGSLIGTGDTPLSISCGNAILVDSTIENDDPGSFIELIAQGSVNMTNSMIIGDPGMTDIDIVVDNAFPAAPFTGPGGFTKDALSTIEGGEVQIYTCLWIQNSIMGDIDGAPYTAAQNVPDANNQYFIYYPGGMFNSPYAVFYKAFFPFVPPAPPPPPPPSPLPPFVGNLPAIVQSEALMMLQRFNRNFISNPSITVNEASVWLPMANFLIPQFD